MSGPSQDSVVQALQVLVAGTGYNFYDKRNQMRADDLLVRLRAGAALTDGARALVARSIEYGNRYIPHSTRERPYPPPESLEEMRSLRKLAARLDDLSGQILGMPVPTQDKTWWRWREEKATLARLLDFDYRLVLQSSTLGEQGRSLTLDEWRAGGAQAAFDAAIAPLEALIHERALFLRSA